MKNSAYYGLGVLYLLKERMNAYKNKRREKEIIYFAGICNVILKKRLHILYIFEEKRFFSAITKKSEGDIK